jgi:hypothetical protein
MSRNRPRLLLCIAALAMLALAIPTAAQPAPRVPDVTVAAASINDVFAAQPIHGYLQVEVTDFSDATSDVGDPTSACHPSSPNQPDETVWFEFSVGAGAVDFSTSGSTFSTSGGGVHIVTIYREEGSALTEVGCDLGGTGDPAQVTGLSLTAGNYFAVVGVPSGDTVTSGTLIVTIDFAPVNPPSNDDFANAKPLKLPANPTSINLESATYEPGEVVSSCATVDRPSVSVWYSITVQHTTILGMLIIYAQGSGHDFLSTGEGIITLFEQTGFGLNELLCDSSNPTPSLFGIVAPGTYYIRLEADQMSGISQVGLMQLVINPSVSEGNPSFTETGSVQADLSGWNVKNGDANDAIECGVSACSFRFHSSGAGEATQLVTSAGMSNLKFKKYDILAFTLQYTSLAPDIGVKVIVKYSDGTPKTKLTGDITAAGTIQQFVLTTALPSKHVQSIKAKLKNNDTTLDNETEIHLAFLNAFRLGEMTPRGVLPPPPAAQ